MTELVPRDADLALQVRLDDRFYDLSIQVPMQKIVTDWLRPEGKADPHGVEQAWTLLETSLGMVEQDMAGKTWAVGDTFTMADCAGAPALFYANKLMPLSEGHKTAAAHLQRLMQRPSMARVLEEAKPYFSMFPG